MSAFPHYFKALPPGCKHVDVYRVLSLFEVADPALQHAVKKLLCAGARGAKDQGQDIAEAIATLQRWQQMRAEEQEWRRDAKERQLNASQEIQDRLDRIPVYAPARCFCGARDARACPGQWEPGCDLGANEAHAVPAPPEEALALREAMQPAADPEDAACLARWANAPEWADELVQSVSGTCRWGRETPTGWVNQYAGENLLGSVRCEPRPVQGVGP